MNHSATFHAAADWTANSERNAVMVDAALRIAVVTETYPPEINGVALTLRQWVTSLSRRGHRLLLIRPRQMRHDQPHADDAEQTVLVAGVPLPSYKALRFGLPCRKRLQAEFTAFVPDVIYIATQGPLGGSALNAARRLGIPAITGFHTNFDHYSRYYGLGLLKPIIQGFLRRFHNRSHATLVPTDELRQRMLAQGYRDCRVLARGVDTQVFNPVHRSPTLREHWGVDAKQPIVLYVGRLAAEKNLDLAVRTFREMQTVRADARFVLVGDGPMTATLQAEHPDFIFCGMQVGETLARHYASADIFLFASVTETFGNVIVEAMASGLAPLAFDYAAAREHVQHRHSGFLAPLGDEDEFTRLAHELVQSEATWRQLGQAARQVAERLDWQRIHSQLESLFFEFANEARA